MTEHTNTCKQTQIDTSKKKNNSNNNNGNDKQHTAAEQWYGAQTTIIPTPTQRQQAARCSLTPL